KATAALRMMYRSIWPIYLAWSRPVRLSALGANPPQPVRQEARPAASLSCHSRAGLPKATVHVICATNDRPDSRQQLPGRRQNGNGDEDMAQNVKLEFKAFDKLTDGGDVVVFVGADRKSALAAAGLVGAGLDETIARAADLERFKGK